MEPDATSTDTLREKLLDAALAHVPFDGWSRSAFRAAALESGIGTEEAWRVCTRGPLDLAVAHHRRGDGIMRDAIAAEDLSGMRIRDRVTHAVRTRIETDSDREIVRRSSALFALPSNSAVGARLIWDTSDAIWIALGDSSDDVNWYTKRMILSGVHSATVLYWLGDGSAGSQDTWAFLDRRVAEVMEFERFKGRLRENPMTKGAVAAAEAMFSKVRAPSRTKRRDLPGR